MAIMFLTVRKLSGVPWKKLVFKRMHELF